MKQYRIFLRDLRLSLRSFISLWIILAPVLLAALLQLATPGITDSFLHIALMQDAPESKTTFYQQYAAVHPVRNEQEMAQRVLRRDMVLGLMPLEDGSYEILAQGNEPPYILDAIKLLKTYEETGTAPAGSVSFSDLGRTTPPLKTMLITSLLMLVTILSGMLIALGLVDEKSDKTIRAMQVAPVSTTTFVLGKSLLGIIYTLLSSLSILWISGFLTRNVFLVLLVLLSSACISFVVGFLVGLSSDDFIAAAGNVKLVMLPAMAAVLTYELAAPGWHFLAWWSPFYWGYDAIKGLLSQSATWQKVLMDCSIILALALILYLALFPHIRRKLAQQ